jgi:hypothetical protein
MGLFAGFIIANLSLFFIIGGLNTFLLKFIWDVRIPSGFQSILEHGFVLSIELLIAYIPQIILNIFDSNLALTLVLFIVYCFIDGLIARNVADYWFLH